MTKTNVFPLTELSMNEKLTSSFRSAKAVSSTWLNVSVDMVGARVARRIQYGFWIGIGVETLVYGARQGGR